MNGPCQPHYWHRHPWVLVQHLMVMVAEPGAIYSLFRKNQNRNSCHCEVLLSCSRQQNTPAIPRIYCVIFITCPTQSSSQPWTMLFSPSLYRRESDSQVSHCHLCCCDKILRQKAAKWRKCISYYKVRLQPTVERQSRQELQIASPITFTSTSREM